MKRKTYLQLALISLFSIALSSCNSQTNETNKTDSTTNNTQVKEKNTMKSSKEIIVDVRTREEWEQDGHADCSVNYPLNELSEKIDELKNYEHIVLVCRSGARAGVAKGQLESAGISNIENKGAWQNISCN